MYNWPGKLLGTHPLSWFDRLTMSRGRPRTWIPWQWWSSERDLILAGQVAPFGAAVYGAAMFLVERISRMFWAWAQRDKDIEKAQYRMAKRLKDAGIPPEVLDKAKDKAQEDAREPVRR